MTGEIFRISLSNLRQEATVNLGVGLSTKLSQNALFYASLGKTLGQTADGATHLNLLAGVKFLFGDITNL